jgi:quercetin dioxygenase-like cupin family protein
MAYQTVPLVQLDLDKLPWEPIEKILGGDDAVTEHASGVVACVVARNDETGAMTYVARLPAGFRTSGREAHSYDQQNIILDGEITTDLDTEPISMIKGSYRCIPAGVFHGPAYTENGCVTMEFASGPFDIYYEDK